MISRIMLELVLDISYFVFDIYDGQIVSLNISYCTYLKSASLAKHIYSESFAILLLRKNEIVVLDFNL